MSDPRIPTKAERAELLRLHTGCGDNSCRFKRPAGMATNGGCRCLGERSQFKALQRLAELTSGAAHALDMAEKALREIAEQECVCPDPEDPPTLNRWSCNFCYGPNLAKQALALLDPQE